MLKDLIKKRVNEIEKIKQKKSDKMFFMSDGELEIIATKNGEEIHRSK